MAHKGVRPLWVSGDGAEWHVIKNDMARQWSARGWDCYMLCDRSFTVNMSSLDPPSKCKKCMVMLITERLVNG